MFDDGQVHEADKSIRIVVTICYIVCFLAMCVTTIIVTSSDPTDPTIALERLAKLARSNGMANLDFDSNDYYFHCDICDTHVLKNTKHCQRCNRCSYEFDHHCVWVSNDIGLHNYAPFIRMLIAVFLTISLQLAFCAQTLSFLDSQLGEANDEFEIGLLTKYSMKVLTIVTLVVTLVLFLMDSYLLIFHIYLMCKNTSTYKHIRRQQKRRKSRVIKEV